MRATADDAELFRRWAGRGCKYWVIQSLWIKMLYMNRSGSGLKDQEWFEDFPPVMNRSHFLPYACMLYRIYLKEGMVKKAKALADTLGGERYFTDNVKRHDWSIRLNFKAKLTAKNIIFSLN
jgi:hypothetical protein